MGSHALYRGNLSLRLARIQYLSAAEGGSERSNVRTGDRMPTRRPLPRATGDNLVLGELSHGATKRSVILRGRRTSVSLEALFWETIKVAARESELGVSALLNHVDRVRGDNNLSSALRVFALLYIQGTIPREALRSVTS